MCRSRIISSPSARRGRLPPTMSDGARWCRVAASSWSGPSERISSRARSSAPASGRNGSGPSSGETAGSAPRKQGVMAWTRPSTIRLFSETWWPPNRQPHGSGAAGLAEHPQVVQLGVAATVALPVGHPALGVVEDVLQPDDRGHGDVTGRGQPAGHQLVREPLLAGGLGAQGQPAVVGRGVEPALPLGLGLGSRSGRGPGGHRPLVRLQRLQPRLRGLRHPGRHLGGCGPPLVTVQHAHAFTFATRTLRDKSAD